MPIWESCQKKAVMIRKAENYQFMEPTKKQKLSIENAEKYSYEAEQKARIEASKR